MTTKSPIHPPQFRPVRLTGTWIFALASMSLVLWHSIFHQIWTYLLIPLMGLALFVCFVTFIGVACSERSRLSVQRLGIIAGAVVLIIPITFLGDFIREKLILRSLPEFQRAADRIAATTPDFDHMDKRWDDTPNPTSRFASAEPPTNWLIDGQAAIFRHKDGNWVVIFHPSEMSFLHRELLYSPDDDLTVIFPNKIYAKRIAPKWYTEEWD